MSEVLIQLDWQAGGGEVCVEQTAATVVIFVLSGRVLRLQPRSKAFDRDWVLHASCLLFRRYWHGLLGLKLGEAGHSLAQPAMP